jgi:hypothetical protein
MFHYMADGNSLANRQVADEHVRDAEDEFRTALRKLLDLPLVGDHARFVEIEQILRSVLTEAQTQL